MKTTINISLFAGAADAAGEDVIALEFTENSIPLRDLAEEMIVKHPELKTWVACSRWAVDHEFVFPETTTVTAENVVALIPPVSGG